ncbi:MAG: glycine cleavage system aminomethyltransferase GcvT [Acidobacteriota bacterium]
MPDDFPLKRTPLYRHHVEHGARMVPFAGWDMPVQYSGVIEEHRAVRQAAGLFDVSHMGEFEVSGPGALAWLQRVTPNDVSRLVPGQAHYSALLTGRGTFIDDLLVYRLAAERFMLVVNAGNRAVDLEWLEAHGEDGAVLRDLSEEYALLALQGPAASNILERAGGAAFTGLSPFHFREGTLEDVSCLISRTGYTGEDGFEIYLPPDRAGEIFEKLLAIGREDHLLPVGLGARDTLRLEAALCLAGQDIDDSTTPLEAGLSFIVRLDKGDFIGRDVLVRQRDEGVARRLTGFRMVGRGVGRHGHAVRLTDGTSSTVTSGTHAPMLGYPIGLAYLPPASRQPGTLLEVLIRERPVKAQVVPIPFYRRPRS